MHNLVGKQSATLDNWGGLVTLAGSAELPEGSAARSVDMDYLVGSARTRLPLQGVYSFAGAGIGPKLPSKAVDVSLGLSQWTNPAGVESDTSFATATLSGGAVASGIGTPERAQSLPGYSPWSNPDGAFATGSTDYAALSQVTPPFTVPSGQKVAYALPTLVQYGTNGTGLQTGSAVANENSATIEQAASCPTCVYNYNAWWSGFALPELPSDAVIQGAWPVVVASVTANSSENSTVGGAYGPNLNPLELNLGGNALKLPQSGASYPAYSNATISSPSGNSSDTIGTTAAAIENCQIAMQLYNSAPDGNYPSPTILTVSYIGIAIYYTTAQNPPVSGTLLVDELGLSIPGGATIQGVKVNFDAGLASGSGATLNAQLALNGIGVGAPKTVTPGTWPTAVSLGGASDLWGAGLNAAGVNGTNGLGILFTGSLTEVSQLNLNSASATVYYTLPEGTDLLEATGYGFNLNPTPPITGVEVTATAYGTGSLTAQLLKAGVPVGTPITVTLPASAATVTFGGGTDLWGATWSPTDFNAENWGVALSASAPAGASGTVAVQELQATVWQPAGATNFTYIKTFQASNGALKTLALDSGGNLWIEDVTNNPGVMTLLLEGITAGYANGTTLFDREYLAFSDLSQGRDIPRQYTLQGWTDRVTQCGPGAPPSFQAATTASSSATITAFSITSNVVTFTAANGFTAGEVVTIEGLSIGTYLNGVSFSVLGTGLSATQFEVAFTHANVSTTSDSGTAIPQYNYPIAASPTGITQPPVQVTEHPNLFDALLWSSGPGSTSAGNVITIYYLNGYQYQGQPDEDLVNAFNAGIPVYVYVSGAPVGNGIQLVTSVGLAVPPGGEYARYYFTFQVPTSNYQSFGGKQYPGSYQRTEATITTSTPVPGLQPGNQVQLTGVGVANWNSTWTVVRALNSGSLSITQTSLIGGVATYSWELISGVAPAAGQLVTITGTLNGNGLFNVTEALIASATGTTAGTFTIGGFPGSQTIAAQSEPGQATTAGTQFTIDPGAQNYGTSVNPIFGNSGGGLLSVVSGSSAQVLGSGTRQGVVIFQTRNGALTRPSAPVTFTTPDSSNYIYASNIPLGPPNTVARVIAFTEAGANGVPGGFFYTIPNPVAFIVAGVQYLSSSLTINDNTTTSAKFTFTDAVLLAETEIDVQGNDLFNQIAIGNAGWFQSYAGRLFAGLLQNKIQNFVNLSFDGGYLPASGGANELPLGWGVDAASNPSSGTAVDITAFSITNDIVTFTAANGFTAGQLVVINNLTVGTYLNGQQLQVLAAGLSGTEFQCAFTYTNVGTTNDSGTAAPVNSGLQLNVSPVFGNSLYMKNTTAATQAVFGMIVQSAYQDAYQVPILLPNTLYSVRVTCRCPSGVQTGALTIDLTTGNNGNYGTTYGAYTLDLSAMTTTMATYTGTLLTGVFSQVPSDLLLRVWAANLPYNGDLEIDRIEVFPTLTPVLAADVLGSYVANPEGMDQNTGFLGLDEQNAQPVNGAALLYDLLYFLKESSIYSTQDSPGSEPDGWTLHEVSNVVGAIGPNAWDYGEEWLVTACRRGVFAFNGGQPAKIMQEIFQVWEAINWQYGRTIWLRNDIVNRRLYVGVPLATPNKWMPNAPLNANPTSPNVVLMLNWQGLDSFAGLAGSPQMHTTMFGTLASLDMRRKWSIWQIPSPYAGFITRGDGFSAPLLLGSGFNSGKIYQFADAQGTADEDLGNIGWQYTTWGFVNAAKAQQMPLLGFHRKRYTYLQTLMTGSGTANVALYPNILSAEYPWTIPGGIALSPNAQDDYERPLNIIGQRIFVDFTPASTGAYADISKLILVGSADAWAPIRGTGI